MKNVWMYFMRAFKHESPNRTSCQMLSRKLMMSLLRHKMYKPTLLALTLLIPWVISMPLPASRNHNPLGLMFSEVYANTPTRYEL